jgi:hypothetical protein
MKLPEADEKLIAAERVRMKEYEMIAAAFLR